MNDFIFSKKVPDRTGRHLSFWVARLLFISVSCNLYDVHSLSSFLANYRASAIKLLLFIVTTEIPYTYTLIYLLAPVFLYKKKTTLFLLSALLASFLLFYYNFYSSLAALSGDERTVALFGDVRDFFLCQAPATCLVFYTIKLFKTWYLKQQEKQQLLQANADAEIQVLKAQVHPHFLFNTLNNIYAFTLNRSARAGELVLQLSDLMKYMITECNTELVPLEKEVEMIRDYIGLEKVRYGNNLDLRVEIQGDLRGKLIAPLLLLPFVENSFKHGASKLFEHPWIELKIKAAGNILHVEISNNKLEGPAENKNGIGLKNVGKRLQLLYQQRYDLQICPEPETFLVKMRVPLAS